MQKLVSYLLVFIMLLSLVGCGAEQQTDAVPVVEETTDNIETDSVNEEKNTSSLVNNSTESSIEEDNTQPKTANLFKNNDAGTDETVDIEENDRQSTTSFKVESQTNWISTKLNGKRTIGNITFAEPKEWNPTEAKSPVGMYYYPYGDKSTGIIYVSYQNLPKSNPTKNDFMDFINSTVESKDMVEDSKSVKVAGLDGYMATVKLTVSSSGDYEAIEYVFVDNKYIYSFMFGDKGILSEEMKEFSSKMIGTVVANNKSNDSKDDSSSKKEETTKNQDTSKQDAKTESSSTVATTTGQKNALSAAKNYLKVMPFSHKGLQEQLTFDGYTSEEALYAADNCNADWNAQALKAAKQYLSTMPFSAKGLKEQLTFDSFTSDQAQYGVDNCGADWNEQSKKAATQYLSIMSFSRSELIEQLKFDGYTSSQAEYGASANGY